MSAKQYDVIFREITEALERGVTPWKRPWVTRDLGAPVNGITGHRYQGANHALLYAIQNIRGYTSDKFATYKQWQAAGKQVKKGESGIPVVWYSQIVKEEKAADGSTEKSAYNCLKLFFVFNESQLEGYVAPRIELGTVKPIEAAEALIKSSPMATLRVQHENDGAYYSPQLDFINMPPRNTFISAEDYYSTLFHEYGHATGHESRLNRDLKISRFTDHSYSAEELVAELTSAFLCNAVGIDRVEQNAAYCKSWLKAFKDHPKAMLKAFSQATAAAEYFQGRQTVKAVA